MNVKQKIEKVKYFLSICFRVRINFSKLYRENFYKTSVLVLPNYAPWLGLRIRKCLNFAWYGLLENVLFNLY